jgi:hypothetical protein
MPMSVTLEQFIALVEENAHADAIEAFYAPNASMQQDQSVPCVGRNTLVANERRALARAKRVVSKCVRPVFLSEYEVVIRSIYEFQWLDGTVTRMVELAYQRWEGECSVEEQFFHDPAQLAPKSVQP